VGNEPPRTYLNVIPTTPAQQTYPASALSQPPFRNRLTTRKQNLIFLLCTTPDNSS